MSILGMLPVKISRLLKKSAPKANKKTGDSTFKLHIECEESSHESTPPSVSSSYIKPALQNNFLLQKQALDVSSSTQSCKSILEALDSLHDALINVNANTSQQDLQKLAQDVRSLQHQDLPQNIKETADAIELRALIELSKRGISV